MFGLKRVVNLLLAFVYFSLFGTNNADRFMLPSLFRHALVVHYNNKYKANIAPINSYHHKEAFFNAADFWYLFTTSDYYKKSDDVRLMWFVGIEAGHSVPVFYIQENGKRAFLVADSIGQGTYYNYLLETPFYKDFNIPVFIIEDRRQNDSFSCFLDALTWGKMVTGKLSNGSYRIPQLLEFLSSHSEKIMFDTTPTHLYRVKKLPTTLFATTQCETFIKKYRIEGDDSYVSSKGTIKSFDSFLSKNRGAFEFDYLRRKGVYISSHFYKYLPYKEAIKYGLNIIGEEINKRDVMLSKLEIFVIFCLGVIANDVGIAVENGSMRFLAKIFNYQ